MKNTKYDLVIMGATGFTGKLVVEYLLDNYGLQNEKFSWAIAGRSENKIKILKKSLVDYGSDVENIPVFLVDSFDEKSIDEMTSKCRLVITTVGPYLKYGHLLVKSCARNGTHYCDLTGEVPFIKESIDQCDKIAKKNNCRIIHSCGFDSIPSDIGVLLLQNEAIKKFGKPFNEIKLYVRGMRGGFSGGTIHSMFNIYEYVKSRKDLQKALGDPYSLIPKTKLPSVASKPGLRSIKWDNDIMRWVCPFAMAGINTKIVRRSNGILNNYYGNTFQYSEVFSFRRGIGGYIKALTMFVGLAIFKIALKIRPLSYILKNIFLPQPGQGPSRKDRENGYFKIEIVGFENSTKKLGLIIEGDSDAGYSGTAKMITESALSILLNEREIPKTSGVLTTASGIGETVAKRLGSKGITFNFN